MARQRRSFAPATSYHVTMRCNNQAFDLRRPQSRKAILFCLAKARGRFDFTLFGICVMSNHVHYMIRPGAIDPSRSSRRGRDGAAGACGGRLVGGRRSLAAKIRAICLPLVPGITGGADRCGGRCRWRSCGPMCSTRSSGLFSSISHIPHCRSITADGEE
jgi:hypothetical protein